MREEIVQYGQGTNVLCKACRQRKIFLVESVKVCVCEDGRYLLLKCPSPGCNRICRYDENELELH